MRAVVLAQMDASAPDARNLELRDDKKKAVDNGVAGFDIDPYTGSVFATGKLDVGTHGPFLVSVNSDAPDTQAATARFVEADTGNHSVGCDAASFEPLAR